MGVIEMDRNEFRELVKCLDREHLIDLCCGMYSKSLESFEKLEEIHKRFKDE